MIEIQLIVAQTLHTIPPTERLLLHTATWIVELEGVGGVGTGPIQEQNRSVEAVLEWLDKQQNVRPSRPDYG